MKNIRTYIFRGLIASIPLMLCWAAVRTIYGLVDKPVNNLFDMYLGWRIPGLGVLCVLIVLFVIGVFTSNVLGRQFFNFVEGVFSRIPLLKAIYQIGKQVSSSFSMEENQAFKKVVLIDYAGIWAIGFVTGTLKSDTNVELFRVFIPTVPNPTTGFVVVVSKDKLIDPGWSVEQGMKAIISGGIIGPEVMTHKKV